MTKSIALLKRLNLVFSLFFITISLFSCSKKNNIISDEIKAIEENNNAIYERTKNSVVRVLSCDDNNQIIDRASGVVIDKKYILTNFHAVKGAANFVVQNYNRQVSYNAELLIVDELEDLAILKPKSTKGLQEITFSTDEVKVGDRCVSISFPSSNEYPVDEIFLSSGYVAAIFSPIRELNGALRGGMIASDTRTLTGSSGGALLNKRGELIALNISVINDKNGVSFSCGYNSEPLSRVVAKMLTEHNKRRQSVSRKAWLDVNMVQFDLKEILSFYPTSERDRIANGMLVTDVKQDGNCERVLKRGNERQVINGREVFLGGDVIKSINGCEIRNFSDVYTSLRDRAPGDEVEVKFLRGREERTANITLSEAPKDYYKSFILY